MQGPRKGRARGGEVRRRGARRPAAASGTSARARGVLALADEAGLLAGARTTVVRGRMPQALVTRAKARTGIESDTALIELALASLAVADDFPGWLLSQKGTVAADLDLDP
jgi:hypothetical protein